MSEQDFVNLCKALVDLGPCVPGVGQGPDGQLMLCWDRDDHHLEIELIPGKPAEVFYRNRATNECWGFDSVEPEVSR